MSADCWIFCQTCRGRPDLRDISVDGTLVKFFFPSCFLWARAKRAHAPLSMLYVRSGFRRVANVFALLGSLVLASFVFMVS